MSILTVESSSLSLPHDPQARIPGLSSRPGVAIAARQPPVELHMTFLLPRIPGASRSKPSAEPPLHLCCCVLILLDEFLDPGIAECQLGLEQRVL